MTQSHSNKPDSDQFNALSIIVGAIVCFIFLAIASGGIEAAAGIIAGLVVCTLGIGLLLYLSVSWIVGALIVGPFWLLLKSSKKQPTSNLPEMPPSSAKSLEQIALVEYITKAQNKGMSESQITVRLEAQGWNSRDIEMARNFANLENN